MIADVTENPHAAGAWIGERPAADDHIFLMAAQQSDEKYRNQVAQ